MEQRCLNHERKLVELDTQINGVNGKGGIMDKLVSIDTKQDQQTQMINSIHRKMALMTGILLAFQFIFQIWGKDFVKACDGIANLFEKHPNIVSEVTLIKAP